MIHDEKQHEPTKDERQKRQERKSKNSILQPAVPATALPNHG
jgi:hypothetical protein